MAYGLINADVIGTSVAGSNLGAGNASIMKNRIINGAMVIDQRNAGASVTINSDQYTLDRWKAFQSATGKYSVQQNAGSVTPPTGFTNYLGATSLSAYSVSSSDYFLLNQPIEGFNVADLDFGKATAKTITISFWVRSSLTGTFGGSITNANFNRTYPFTYTVSSANIWQQISVSFTGDTSGTWETGNGNGMQLRFVLGAGSSRLSSSINQWVAGGFDGPTGSVSVVGTSGATFYITGVQLEVGSSATGFEYRQYQQELALCQRYYQQWGGDTVYQRVGYGFPDTPNRGECCLYYLQTRANPTISFNTASNFRVIYISGGSAIGTSATSTGAAEISTTSARMYWGTGASFPVGTPTSLGADNNTAARIYINAEL